MKHDIRDLQIIFHQLFRDEYKTQLVFGAGEPFYQASSLKNHEHIIYCREDFFASALHEIAHWSLAGRERRQQDDYGYWYSPDGRNREKQLQFEKVEIKPQAIEKAFSIASNYSFKASIDNLVLENHNSNEFISNINIQFNIYQQTKFPKRARQFIKALREFYC
ncbi:elongation factor P hydroxylase [Halobacteriovorax sp. JY17]|uniref:elongation factor P hydroxylase n=1 Tax=Halobacteriovorax sp. JY17 TaxID=2014617 RepID=UPI000C48093F|nr:elongation factor P hydroxylase [Halobacteriovorax sp. JY17]PIK14018.1 MAG: elongation factor P hydroxylase [Halobacteriovorax sp. JY17]